MSKKKEQKFGWPKATAVVLLALFGAYLISNYQPVGWIFIIAMFCLIFADRLPARSSRSQSTESKHVTEKPASKAAEETVPDYDPANHGKHVKCPYCGKSVPLDIRFCFFCGKSLEAFKQIREVRLHSLGVIDKALPNVDAEAPGGDIREIRKLTDQILTKFEEKPERVDHSSKFMEYYLPKAVSAIEHYGVLCSLEDLDEDEVRIKGQIEDSLSVIAEAFSNILNRVSTEGLFDISADVRVLETVLKQDGLTDPEFDL